VRAAILKKSGRRCCLCFSWRDPGPLSDGRFFHLDGNNKNEEEDNLVYVCKPCFADLVCRDELEISRQLPLFDHAVRHARAALYETLEAASTNFERGSMDDLSVQVRIRRGLDDLRRARATTPVLPLNYGSFERILEASYCFHLGREGESLELSAGAHDLVNRLIDGAYSSAPCFYCGTRLQILRLPFSDIECVCPGCHWFYTSETTSATFESIGFLRAFDLSDTQMPVIAIAAELLQSWERIHELNPRRMEEFVACLLRGSFDCETRWVGRTGDGGVDVLVLMADKPLAVQVKRRASPDRSEGVQIIREFCGAMVASDYKRGLFVTTAHQFSRAAHETAGKVQGKCKLERLDLIDCRGLCDLLSFVGDDPEKWKRAFH